MNTKTLLWLAIFFAVLIWSAIDPHDRLTWWLEVAPALLALVLIAATRQRFPLTPLLYLLILVPSVGGLIIFVFSLIPSQKHENKWGPVPDGIPVPEAVGLSPPAT